MTIETGIDKPDHDGAAQVAQEEEQHQEGEHRTRPAATARRPSKRRPHVLRVAVDELVVELAVVLGHAPRAPRPPASETWMRVGLGLLVDQKRDDRLVAEQRGALGLLDRVEHRGHVADADRRSRRDAMMSVAAISSRVSYSPSMRRLRCSGPWRTLPPGKEMLLRARARADVLDLDAVDRQLARDRAAPGSRGRRRPPPRPG